MSAPRRRSARQAVRTSDATRARDVLVAGVAGAAGLTAAALGLRGPTGAASPGALSGPHATAKLACAACHHDGQSAAASCAGCHGKEAHASTRAAHRALAASGQLRCTTCHPAHGDAQTVALHEDGTFVRTGGGAAATGQLSGGAPRATVPLVTVEACRGCHNPSSPTDPAARCIAAGDPHDAHALLLCMDEHQRADAETARRPTASGHASVCARQHGPARFAAWDAAKEAAAKSGWVEAPRARTGPVAWTGAGVLGSVGALAGLRLFGRRGRGAPGGPLPGSGGGARKLPVIDTSTCLGCYACVDACPFDVLEVRRFVAVVARPDDCCGVVLCEQACPNGSLGIGDAQQEDEAVEPWVSASQESAEVPGLYVAGDLTGLPLIKNAIAQGSRAIDAIGASLKGKRKHGCDLDVVVVGAGPAGLAASLRAKELGLKYLTLEQHTFAASIQSFPRNKLVYDAPLQVPVEGELWLEQSTKEQLLAAWTRVVRKHALRLREHQRVVGIERDPGEAGGFRITAKGEGESATRSWTAARVLVAIGKRGTPRRLEAPIDADAEAKVSYSLADARSFAGARVVVVGLGDAAMEAAVALSRQPGTEVTVVHRGAGFQRGKARNIEELQGLVGRGKVRLLFDAQVVRVRRASVGIRQAGKEREAPNDVILALIGGVPSWELLRGAGVMGGPHGERGRTGQILSDAGP